MKRLKKIVSEQITSKSKLGDWGIINDNWESINPKLTDISKKLVNDESINVVSFVWWVINEGTSFKTVASNLGQSRQYGKNSQFNTGKYIYVIDEKIDGEKRKRKPIEYFPVYIVPVTTSDIPKSTYNIGTSPVVSMQQYTKWKAAAAADAAEAKAKADAAAIAAAEKNKHAIEKTVVVVQNVVKGTETIDINKLGKGTKDAKAFQELLYQAGKKLDFKDEPAKGYFETFAKYRTKGVDGGWGGIIGDITLDALYQFESANGENLETMWSAGKKADVIKELGLTLAMNESTNYFKGTGMNVKLKDILREQLFKEQARAGAGGSRNRGGGGSTTTSTTKKKPSSTNFDPDTFPAEYTGKATYTWANGDKYVGDFKKGQLFGQGTYTWANGTGKSYVGGFTYDQYDGQGTYTWASGARYVGNWLEGAQSGPGIYKSKTGTIYDGPWSNRKKNGEFKITYPNGNIRVGTFSNDELSGPVTFTKKGGEPVQETWKDGKKLLDIEDLYKKSVAETEDILLKYVNYVTNHSHFAGYKSWSIVTDGDDEEAALNDLVKPWVQANIQPKVASHYNTYIKPYMDMYNVSNDALTVEYDWHYVGTNNSVTNISNVKFRKIIQNYLILKANSSNTALNDVEDSSAYYNYAGNRSSYTIPSNFYNNTGGSVYYWNEVGGRALFDLDTDF